VATTFPFAFDARFAPMALVTAGAHAGNSSVVLDDDQLVVRFGWLGVRTPVDNIKDVQITRDYRWFKAIGARLSLSDRGATYGSNTAGGVCVCFHEPVRALPVAASPGLTVTVEDLDGFAAAVRAATGLDA